RFVARAGRTDATAPGDYIVGRMWSSQDGKGRARFPMVVCVHAATMSLTDALGLSLPALDALASRCGETTDAAEVVAFVDAERHRVRAEAARLGAAPSPPSPTLKQLVNHPDLGPAHRGLHRLLYQSERELTPFVRRTGSASRSRDLAAAARQVRIPACGSTAAEIFEQWFTFLDSQLDPAAPLMLIWARSR